MCETQSSQSTVALTLASSRLLLRLPVPADAQALLDFHLRNDQHLAPTDPPRPTGFATLEHWRRYIATAQQSFRDGTAYRFVIADKERPTVIIGKSNFNQVFRGPFWASYLGYAIDKEHQGQGKMFEANKRLVRYAFEELHLHRVMANYLPSNERSGRHLRRLGFVVEGYARDYLMIDGQWRDHILTSLTNKDWQPPEPQ